MRLITIFTHTSSSLRPFVHLSILRYSSKISDANLHGDWIHEDPRYAKVDRNREHHIRWTLDATAASFAHSHRHECLRRSEMENTIKILIPRPRMDSLTSRTYRASHTAT